jgi:nucleotide-binding universal stress UspA family protein
MKKILTGYDGSEGAEKALNKATTLLEEDGEIILLGIVPTPSELMDRETYESMKRRAHTLINDIVEGSHKYKIKGIVQEGDPAERIVDIANRFDCDLIVLGGCKIGRYQLADVAKKVVQHAHKPVMIVR